MGKTKNTGLDLVREQAEQLGTEWKFGVTSPKCLFAVPEDDREDFLPIGELQNLGDEKSGCVARAFVNILETKFSYAYAKGLITEDNKKWLDKKGYVKDGRVMFADANIEILSGTTRQGNSLKAPVEAIRKHGLVPKHLLPQLESWDDHYNPARITEDIKNLGLEFLRRFTINYEQVRITDLDTLLAQDTVALALYAWPKPVNGEYPKTDLPLNHCVMGYATPLTYIFDNYGDNGDSKDFIKKLVAEYPLYEYGYRAYVSSQNAFADLPEEQRAPLFSWLARMIAWLFTKNGPMPEIPKEILPEKPTVPVKESKIELWALAIEDFESGGNKDAVSYRRNNPGNIKNTEGNFIVYPTYEAGFAALCNYLVRACTNDHPAYVAKAAQLKLKSSGDLTLHQFIQVYAPDGDVITTNYANFIANRLGVTKDTPIKTLL